MASPLKKAGRAVSLLGLQVMLGIFAGFVCLAGIAAFFGHGYMRQSPTDLTKPLLSALLMLCVSEVLVIWYLGSRFKKQWLEELRESPYQKGGNVPPSFATSVLIGGAMTEGLGLFAAVVYLMTGALPALVLTALIVLFLVAQIPREDKLLNTPSKSSK